MSKAQITNNVTKNMCPCGRGLHYTDPTKKRMVEQLVDDLGVTIPVEANGHRWLVPRHYIALHGLKSIELPRIAEQFGFKEVSRV